MKANFVAMGEYYRDTNSLVRTIGRALDTKTREAMIIYAHVEKNGFVSDAYVMPEVEFNKHFLS